MAPLLGVGLEKAIVFGTYESLIFRRKKIGIYWRIPGNIEGGWIQEFL